MRYFGFILVALLAFTLYRTVSGGYCTRYESYVKTCTKASPYTVKCGSWFRRRRCTRYRITSYRCTGRRAKRVCCPGYIGSTCATPVCFGKTTCPNRGTCISPNVCRCRTGYDRPRCADRNECLRNRGGCAHICINTIGSFRCACRRGYYLSPNRRSCIDINECHRNNGGCQHKCNNRIGSFSCACNSGYTLHSNRRNCIDVNECIATIRKCQICRTAVPSNSRDSVARHHSVARRAVASRLCNCRILKIAKCQHLCRNTIGSYECSCRIGYTLGLDKYSCEDIDECTNGQAKCSQKCENTRGSYRCACNAGFTLQPDGKTCKGINECSLGTHKCQQTCVDLPVLYKCECKPGYRLQTDGYSCTDIDECSEKTSGCAHACTNTQGSYTCSCNSGYKLAADGKTCTNIDDCAQVTCLNGGTCIDGVNTYSCACKSGYTGKLCGSDINECSFLNGGCQDICTNIMGSFSCACSGGAVLQPDGKTCTGSAGVFKRHKLARKLLPRGCSMIRLTTCTDGKQIQVYLSSTDDWYTLKINSNIVYTFGIVFAEVNDLSLPISLVGVVVHNQNNGFTISLGVKSYTKAAGNIRLDKRITDCVSFPFTAKDLIEFVSANSFIKSLFDKLFAALPDWAQLEPSSTDIISAQGLKTDLIYGRDMDQTLWCEGAPVFPQHLYSVFRFDTSFSLSLYSNDVTLPKPLNGRKFCLIVDICHNYGGSVFLMIPEESRAILTQLQVFKKLYEENGVLIYPRGVGISVVKGVNVHYKETQMRLWNGDQMFTYPVMQKADLWIGGGAEKNVSKKNFVLDMKGEVDVFLSVPRPNRILTAVFIDEWNALVKVKASATATLTFKLFGKQHSINFKDIGTVDVGVYMSIGGVTTTRKWCGTVSNPPGIFLSTIISVNLFRNIPVLEDFGIVNSNKLYVFATTDPASRITNDMKIDIMKDIVQLKDIIKRLETLLQSTIVKFASLISNAAKAILQELQNAVNTIKTFIASSLNDLIQGNISVVSALLADLWKHFSNMKEIIIKFIDATEFNLKVAKDAFIKYLNDEMANFKSNIDAAIMKLRNQVIGAAKDYSGFGLKFRTSLHVFGVTIFDVDIEIVYSVDALMACSRFKKVSKLLEGKKAVRILGRIAKKAKLGYFIKATTGAGVGVALSTDTKVIILQLNAYFNLLGLKMTGDLFITKNSMHVYLEGNIWGIFLAQLDISATLGKEWYQLTLEVRGRFVAKVRKRRQIQTPSTSFQASYLDALKKVIKGISDEAQKRITQAQAALTAAQGGLTKAQNWLESKKKDVQKANVAFDKAIAALDKAKLKLEQAKGPFKKALEKLNKAQKNVDNLCKIKTCNKICIPGLKCKWCYKKVWGAKIPYPCCKWTSCMIKVPNLICIGKNLICKGIRAIAYLALEAAKIFVRVPMLALDLAKGVLSVAQVVVDKSRIVLKLAEGVLDLAKLGLGAAKRALQIAIVGLEVIKRVLGFAAKVLELVIEYGLKNILDVKNCEFNLLMSTTDLPVFEVSCEVNAFKLGWKKVGIKINFNNILQSLWQAAKAVVKALMKLIPIIGKKKRDIEYQASSRISNYLRKLRSAGPEATERDIEDVINVINSTEGVDSSVETDYESRVLLFKAKCASITHINTFLRTCFEALQNVSKEGKTVMDETESMKNKIPTYNLEEIASNLTLDSAGISVEYANKDYNIPESDLIEALEKAKATIGSDPLIREVVSVTQFSKDSIDAEIKAAESIRIIDQWIIGMENITKDSFKATDCADTRDCIFHSISELYELFTEESVPDIDKIKESITALDANMATLLGTASLKMSAIYTIAESSKSQIDQIGDLHVFCSRAPWITDIMENATVSIGEEVRFVCPIKGDPDPKYWWFKDGEPFLGRGHLNGDDTQILVIQKVTKDDEGVYTCVGGNVVANITSNEAHLKVGEKDANECEAGTSGCAHLCSNTMGSYECSCRHGYRLGGDKHSCHEIDECAEGSSRCAHECTNTQGSFQCTCKQGYKLGKDSKSCADIDECTLKLSGCQQVCWNTIGSFMCGCYQGYILGDDHISCHECHLKAAEGNPNMYHYAGFPEYTMHCEPNQVFSQSACGCVFRDSTDSG